MPIPHRGGLAVDRELSRWLVETVSGGEGGRAAQFKNSDPAQTGNEYTRLARLSSRRDVANSDNKLWSFMEPSGRNRLQPAANATAVKTAKSSQTVALGCDQLPEPFHGKEGVDGSSPSEGFAKPLRIRGVFHVIVANFGDCGSHRVHAVTSAALRASPSTISAFVVRPVRVSRALVPPPSVGRG